MKILASKLIYVLKVSINYIQVTSDVYEPLKRDFVFRCRGEVSIKGKGDMVTYYLERRLNKGEKSSACAAVDEARAHFFIKGFTRLSSSAWVTLSNSAYAMSRSNQGLIGWLRIRKYN